MLSLFLESVMSESKVPPKFQWLLQNDTFKVVNQLIDDYIPRHCMGLNDMGVASGLITAAAIMINAHCRRFNTADFEELKKLGHDIFDMGLNIAGNKEPRR